MKTVISYVAGAALVGWVAYIFVSTEPATRVSRTCMPVGGAVRALGSLMRMLDEETGQDLADEALPFIQACRSSVWYWAYDGQPLPSFNDVDAVFGDYRPRGSPALRVDTPSSSPSATSGAHRHEGDAARTAPASGADDGERL
ncbi:hypothetical protein LMG22037_05667 [Paraburkholderia phenoliruptrix]|jgi:hypothetical protein|uniref:Uncharacterized protein n=1 Tax=Paraburkholderia phenoliruptrix TaxID=252970 RepID=A0A6J5CB03_9BURK|nr:hypothetical protein [Paraburkholderia phenoliruptrix]CAB3732031.1 hypothetical protein LMG22037_05667 [Paraburkholderia phenoliruptrix]